MIVDRLLLAISPVVLRTVDGEVAKVELDPAGLYADLDPSDDLWTP